MQRNLQEIGEEVAKLAKKMSERKSELLGRANTTLQTRLNLEEEWMREIHRPADFTALYQAESKSFFASAETFSAWIETHPEFPSSFIKDALNGPESKNDESKIAFLIEIRNDRLRMLDEELPKLEGIVQKLEKSLVILRNTVAHSS
jgi:hypothetical protein